MALITPRVAEVLVKALALSTEKGGLVIDRLIDSFEDAADDGVEETWSEEIKRRVDEIRLRKVKMVPGEEMRRWFSERLRDAKKFLQFTSRSAIGNRRSHRWYSQRSADVVVGFISSIFWCVRNCCPEPASLANVSAQHPSLSSWHLPVFNCLS